MIKNIIKIKRITKGIALVGFMVYSTLPVFADNRKTEKTVALNEPAVTIASSDVSSALISVQYDNKNKSEFTVIIRDEGGNTMYRQRFNNASFLKTFKILNDETMPAKTTLTIAVEGGSEYVYDVDTTVSFIQTVAVSKK